MYSEISSKFEAIDLQQMSQVSLMERTDKKFVVPVNEINEILEEICDDYYILEINNKRILHYSTFYYDTKDDVLYSNHHNGKLNRYKVRKRTYDDTDTSFLEVKFKSNKGKTAKKRIETTGDEMSLTDYEKSFLKECFPFDPNLLKQKSYNGFKRMTLADKNFTERCTIDFSFRFISNNITIERDNFAIIELKQDKDSKSSKLYDCLFNRRVKPSGFSKYCLGRSMVEKDLRQNSFKQKLREIGKIV